LYINLFDGRDTSLNYLLRNEAVIPIFIEFNNIKLIQKVFINHCHPLYAEKAKI